MPRDARHVADRLLQIFANTQQNPRRYCSHQHEAWRVAKGDEPRLEEAGKKRRRSVDDRINKSPDAGETEARSVDHEKRNKGDKQGSKHGQEIDHAAQPDPVPDVVLNMRPRLVPVPTSTA